MTGVLLVLAILSAVGGFPRVTRTFLEPLLPLPAVDRGLNTTSTMWSRASIAIALAGLAAAAWFFGHGAARAERVRARLPGVNRVLSGKYFVDEAYAAFIGKPLLWISDRVFLRFGDQPLFDGALHGLAALGQRTSRVLGAAADGKPAALRASSCWPDRRRARVEPRAMPDSRDPQPACSSCRSSAIAALSARAARRARTDARMSFAVMAAQLVLAAWLYARFDAADPALQFANAPRVDPRLGRELLQSGWTDTTCCWCCSRHSSAAGGGERLHRDHKGREALLRHDAPHPVHDDRHLRRAGPLSSSISSGRRC
jgi:hypothetical protein